MRITQTAQICASIVRNSQKTGFGPNRLQRKGTHFVGTEPPALKYHLVSLKIVFSQFLEFIFSAPRQEANRGIWTPGNESQASRHWKSSQQTADQGDQLKNTFLSFQIDFSRFTWRRTRCTRGAVADTVAPNRSATDPTILFEFRIWSWNRCGLFRRRTWLCGCATANRQKIGKIKKNV